MNVEQLQMNINTKSRSKKKVKLMQKYPFYFSN